jgi:hypothetical protein
MVVLMLHAFMSASDVDYRIYQNLTPPDGTVLVHPPYHYRGDPGFE